MSATTKNMITEAFVRISDKKSIDKITVKDVVEECNITRQTFYYHFKDIIDVIEWLLQQHTQIMIDKTIHATSMKEAMVIMLSPIKERPEIINKLMNSKKREDTEKILMSAARFYLEEVMRRNGYFTQLKYSEADTALTFYASAIVGVIISNSRRPPSDTEELAEQLCRLIRGDMMPKDEFF